MADGIGSSVPARSEPRPARVSRPGTFAVIVSSEVGKGLRNLWANRVAVLLGMLTLGGLYLGMMLVIGQGALPRDLLPLTVVGMAAYTALWVGSLQMVAEQLEEMRAGTLEQTSLSPVPPGLLTVARVTSTGLQGVLIAVGLVVSVMLGADVSLPWDWHALLPLALTLAQVLAFTALFAGMVLAVPLVGEMHHLVVSLISFFNGAFLPPDLLPTWLHTVARVLPTTLGVEATLDVIHHGQDISGLWESGILTLLVAHTAALCGAAVLVFRRNYRRALRDGNLGRY